MIFPNKKYPIIKQYDQKDCGPAVLLSVLRFYGGNSSLPHLRELCNTNLQGSTMLDIVNAAKTIGFNAFGATGKYEDLMKEKMPAIAHVVIDDTLNHFVVVYKITHRKVYVSDPGKGKYWLTKDNFLEIWKTKSVILLKPEKKLFNKEAPKWYNWVLSYIKNEDIWVYQSLFLGTVYTILGLITALFIQILLDKYIPEKNYSKIMYGGIFLLIVLFLKSFVGYYRQKFLIILNKNVNTKINADFLEHLFKLPKKFFDTRKIGEITARLNDAIRIQRAVLQIVGVSLIDIFVISGSFGLMFYLSVKLSLITLILVPIYALFLFLNVKKLKNEQNEVMKSYALVESTYIDSLKGVDEIISFNSGKPYMLKNKFFFSNYQEKIKNLGFTQANLSFFAESFSSLILAGLLVYGAIMVIEGDLLLGKMMAAYSLLASIIPAVNRFVDTNIVLQETSIASTRLMDMLLVETEKSINEQTFKINKKLSISDGAFSWDGRKILFNKINLTIEQGRITSLWGSSGAGKSTLVQILQRKYKLTSGLLMIDEIDSEDTSLSKYREKIGVVPQIIKIFNGTIAENILLGREIADYSILEKRIVELGLLPFYHGFEYGLATIIGEEGRELSGGEKQLISITRALLNKPQILIIDEGLSGIDIELEKIIFDVIKRYSTDNGVLLITHNLNSIMKTDYVYVLSNETISQEGTPEELLEAEGYFKRMWELKKSIYQNKAMLNERVYSN